MASLGVQGTCDLWKDSELTTCWNKTAGLGVIRNRVSKQGTRV